MTKSPWNETKALALLPRSIKLLSLNKRCTAVVGEPVKGERLLPYTSPVLADRAVGQEGAPEVVVYALGKTLVMALVAQASKMPARSLAKYSAGGCKVRRSEMYQQSCYKLRRQAKQHPIDQVAHLGRT